MSSSKKIVPKGKPSEPKKTGRPSKRTDQIVERILDGLSDGVPLTHICKGPGMPHPNKVREWMTKDPDLSGAIACAREVGADAIAEDALRIADTPMKGLVTKVTPDGTHIIEEDMLGHRRLQVETRLKLLAKWNPKKYGEKIQADVTHDVADPLAQLIRDVRAKRLLQ